MTKAELRKKYKALRNTLTTEAIDSGSLSIANQLLTLNIWEHKFYHLFLSIETQKEVNTDFILNILSGKDKNIVVSPYGIPEPIDGIEIDNYKIDVVFIPLLAYDTKGNRIGYGKGFYDRFLAQ